MLRQIEKLQKMVNNLLGLFKETGAEAVIDGIPCDTSHRKYEKLGVFILKLQDGVLSKRCIRKMHRWITRDDEARIFYIDFIKLTMLLYMHFHPNTFTSPLPRDSKVKVDAQTVQGVQRQ